MEFVQGRRGRQYYCDCEEEEPLVDPRNHHTPLAHRVPPSCSSSSSSSSVQYYSNRPWVQASAQQVEYSSMDVDQQHPPAGSGGGSSEEQQRPRAAFVEKEHMFDKVVTPSDVGKLNRLVIPKQHAEKYFPLDTAANEKGLLLSFEDRTGKPWRFRYSYWNSSQSYVMTKGWSRFVKEKRLDAGDTVSFCRGVGEAGRDQLFIDCKRRPEARDTPAGFLRLPLPGCHTYHHQYHHHHDPSPMVSFSRSVVPWSDLLAPPPPSPAPAMMVYDHHRHLGYGYNTAAASSPYMYMRSTMPPHQVAVQLGVGSNSSYGGGGDGGGGAAVPPVVFESVPAVASSAAAKRVRLFGVNLDYSPPESDAEGDAAGYENPGPPALPSPQLSLASSSDTVESPRRGKQPMSLDLEM